MDVQTLTSFFMWCTIINTGMLGLSTILFMIAPDFIYRIQTMFFKISRESFDVIFYSFLGVYKIMLIVFNIVPWFALLIIS